MAKRLHGLMALSAALLLSSTLGAEPPPLDKEIVVTGIREPEKAAAEFVGAISLDHGGQIARFETSVCPALFGLPDDQKAAVEARLREVAKAAGIAVEDPGCRPNLVVTVAADPADFLANLYRKRPWLFHDLTRSEIDMLTTTRAPARAWHLVGRRESDNRVAQHFFDTQGEYNDAHLTPSHQFSRLKKSTRPALTLAFVVLDLPSIVELTLPQLADYAAMRAFAMTRPGTAATIGGRSILGLFEDQREDRSPAASLTAWDLAYLRALYGTRSLTTATQQKATMARLAAQEIARDVEKR